MFAATTRRSSVYSECLPDYWGGILVLCQTQLKACIRSKTERNLMMDIWRGGRIGRFTSSLVKKIDFSFKNYIYGVKPDIEMYYMYDLV